MKIGPIEPKPPVAPGGTERKSAGTPLPPTAEASTQVELSPAATLIAGAASYPTFDAKKVEHITQAIRDGKFKVNAEAIADKLIVNAQELLGRKSD